MPKLITVTGVIKGDDISEEGAISSGKLYEYRIDSI
jgi:flagellar basal body L-ring protein FlgH